MVDCALLWMVGTKANGIRESNIGLESSFRVSKIGAGARTACTPNDLVSDEMWVYLDRIDQEGKQPPELSGEEEAATVRYEFAYTSAIFDASRCQSDSSS